jgi:hypothetical protein
MMNIIRLCRIYALLALLIPAGLATTANKDAKGWYELDCGLVPFHLSRTDDGFGGRELVLQMETGPIPFDFLLHGDEGWLKVQGEECSRDGKCEQAVRAQVWLNDMKGKTKLVSGRYAVDIGSQHLAGAFYAKIRKHKHLFLCE